MGNKEVGASTGSFGVKDLAKRVGGSLLGDDSAQISGLCSLDEPKAGCLSFVQRLSPKSLERLQEEDCIGALLVPQEIQESTLEHKVPLILVPDPLRALITLVPLFYQSPLPESGIHPSCVVDETATLGEGVRVGPFSFVGPDVRIGKGSVIHSHVAIYAGATIGAGSVIHSHAVIREHCSVGNNAVIQNGAVVGAEGFGYIPDPEIGLVSVPQVGTVSLGDRVDVGANSCIDRATLGSTVIGLASKLDNLVQVGHNTRIGKFSILCGQVGIAGSCEIGDGVTLGGNVGVADHLTIASGSRVAGKSGVTHNLEEKKDYAGFPAVSAGEWRRAQIALRQLPDMRRQLKELKKKCQE